MQAQYYFIKLTTQYGFHELFLKFLFPYIAILNYHQNVTWSKWQCYYGVLAVYKKS
jgi:hypothetical protein